MRAEEINALIFGAAAQLDFATAPIQQPENVLKPDPAMLRHQIAMLEIRLAALEKWAAKMNPTFWNFAKHEGSI